MIAQDLLQKAQIISEKSMFDLPPIETWKKELPKKRKRWLEMLGLDPLPPRTDLKVKITGTFESKRYKVEKLHFQPIPDCRIAANLYLPKKIEGKIPAVIYVCGHASPAKFHYQHHPRWFAEHGYASMILDAIQIGENNGFHHGTHRKNWWHWFSQGYSPVAIEVWAAMRAADYLQARPEVDSGKLGITGNSGGGTVSWYTGAADPRFKVVVPSCQTGNIFQHIQDRSLDGHCDCSFWVNTYGWDLPDIGSLIAPRALQITSATDDCLFHPYAFKDVALRLRKLYIAYGCEEKFRLFDDVIPHGYSSKTRLAIYNWFEKHLKGSDEYIAEDISEHKDKDKDLAVYPKMKPPVNDKLIDIDKTFISLPGLPVIKNRNQWNKHKNSAIKKLKSLAFRQIPDRIDISHVNCRYQGKSDKFRYQTFEFESEPNIPIKAQVALPLNAKPPYTVLAGAMLEESRTSYCAHGANNHQVNPNIAGSASIEVRGTGSTSIGPGIEWHTRRAYPLMGYSYYERKTYDLLAAVSVLRKQIDIKNIAVFGTKETAAIAIYAALLDPEISEVLLEDPVTTHWNSGPEYLNVLHIGDLTHNTTLLFPRKLTFVGKIPKEYNWTKQCYEKCGKKGLIKSIANLANWQPL